LGNAECPSEWAKFWRFSPSAPILETIGCRQLSADGAASNDLPSPCTWIWLQRPAAIYFNNQNKSITSQNFRFFVETSSLDKLKYINRMLKGFPEMKNRYNDDS